MFKRRCLLPILFLLGISFLFSERASAQSYIVNPNQTYTYTKMVKDINKLEKAYPDLVNVKIVGKSEYRRNIYAVSLGKGESTVFINGAHHAREWITTNVNMNMIDKYVNAYQKNAKIDGYNTKNILNHTTIWFIPMVNPDGVTLQQTGLKYFPQKDHAKLIKMNNGSKDFKRWKANAKGVDLNRQYNAKWEELGGGTVPNFKNYKGKSPETASETKSILSFVKEINPEMAISYHSSGQILFWKYGQTGSRYTRDRTYIKKISQMTGYRLISPKTYTSGGGFSDWFSSVLKKPAFTIEVSPYAGETHVPLKNFKKIWKENESIGLFTAQEGAKLYEKRQLTKSDALTKSIKIFNTKAKKLEYYYDTSINKESNIKITKAQTTLYNQVKKEITKQEQNIAQLPIKYQKSAKLALQTTKTYRDCYTYYQAAITAGESLASTNQKLISILSNGTIDTSTISHYDKVKKAIVTVQTKIKTISSKKVRTLATKKYITSIEKDMPAIDNIISRYKVLVEIEKKVTQKEFNAALKDWIELEKLNQQVVTNHPFNKIEQFLQTWQATLKQALPIITPANEGINQFETPEEAPAT